MLLPAPVDLNGTNMDCAYLAAWTDADTGAGLPTNGTTPTGGVIYEFDGTPMTLSEDLTLDGCVIRLLGASLTVKATATNTPAITISNGGKLVIGTSTTAAGSLQAFTSSYPYELDIQDGTLEIDGGNIRDVAQDAVTKSAILVAPGATLIVKNSGTIYGSSATSDDMATVKVTVEVQALIHPRSSTLQIPELRSGLKELQVPTTTSPFRTLQLVFNPTTLHLRLMALHQQATQLVSMHTGE